MSVGGGGEGEGRQHGGEGGEGVGGAGEGEVRVRLGLGLVQFRWIFHLLFSNLPGTKDTCADRGSDEPYWVFNANSGVTTVPGCMTHVVSLRRLPYGSTLKVQTIGLVS